MSRMREVLREFYAAYPGIVTETQEFIARQQRRYEAKDNPERESDEVFTFLAWRVWDRDVRVSVGTTSTMQALLAVTPQGDIEDDDTDSPYNIHATVFNPPIAHPAYPTGNMIVGSFLTLGNLILVPASAEVAPGRFQIKGVDFEKELSGDVAYQRFRSAVRITVGLNRLIRNAPAAEANRRKNGTPLDVAVTDKLNQKKRTRSVFVRNLFVVEPQLVEACKQSLLGGPSAPCLRHIVRGHWRNQAVGQGRTQRRMTWVRPHWKGELGGILPTKVNVR